MYETDRQLGLGFDGRTKELMQAVFGGRVCVRCGEPAERLSADRYFCGVHFPTRRTREESSPRVYRCTAAMSD